MQTSKKPEPRSYLFVPGNRPERFSKALLAGADAVIIDLEDAVPPDEKERARDAVLDALNELAGVYVRINGAETKWFADDIAACAMHQAVKGIVLPKAAGVDTLRAIASRSHEGLTILPLLESAEGFNALDTISAAPRVGRLMFGTIDFQLDMGMMGDGEELAYFRSQMTLASRLAGLGTPVDGVTTALDDAAQIEHAARRARRFGFGGKLCIHPKQIAPIHLAFTPTDDERAWASRVLQAAEASAGSATVVDGKMIDAPVIQRAQAILAAAGSAQ
ncbi:CoA ester lyase [Burkholderia sp. SG-MS1]|uniref:HpcH/HpaI aldolase/citrate lyase family protein n=1 Tax=Paraburkholderia sp. SG-MS1 TaxID=2023741 RepID=UPI001447A080|nr:CoA ester lyase [Paraburkholderia sp. SG-MS1]NKJ48541.1 CoA ester lyase [Paraburkholderia sp. SG-MS1]